MAWMQLASFGINALGHVLNRTGGRKKVKATLADTSFIDDEVETIRSRNEEMSNNFLRTANAGVGFADMTRGRMNSAMGVSGGNSMLESAQIGALENSYNASIQNEAMSQGQINQLMGQRSQLEQFNAQAQNNATATNFQAARADNNNMFGALSAGMLSFANQRMDNQRFNQSMDMQQNSMNFNQNMYRQWLSQQQGGYQPPNVPYGTAFNN